MTRHHGRWTGRSRTCRADRGGRRPGHALHQLIRGDGRAGSGRVGLPVDRLALYEPPFFPGADHAEHLARYRTLLAEGDNSATLRYNLLNVIGLPAEAVDEMAASPWWPALAAAAPTLPYDLSAVHEINLDPDLKARWAGVTMPTVVYSGDATFPGMPEAADLVAAALPNASRRVVAGQGHGPATEAILPLLVEFLRS